MFCNEPEGNSTVNCLSTSVFVSAPWLPVPPGPGVVLHAGAADGLLIVNADIAGMWPGVHPCPSHSVQSGSAIGTMMVASPGTFVSGGICSYILGRCFWKRGETRNVFLIGCEAWHAWLGSLPLIYRTMSRNVGMRDDLSWTLTLIAWSISIRCDRILNSTACR